MAAELKECKVHGETPFVLRRDGRFRCRRCSADAVTKRRREIKRKAVEYMGGACLHCGYKKSVAALQFHHLDPSQKDFGISTNGQARSWEATRVELDKCIMLCSNCHMEEHEKLDAISVIK